MAPTEQLAMHVVPGFEEPFIATGQISEIEDEALLSAIAVFLDRSPSDGFAALTQFLDEYPESAWRTAVLTNLGLAYYHHGYFSKALGAWQLAWDAGRGATEARAKALTDRAVGELFRMHARLGHVKQLSALFEDLGQRPISGQAKEAVAGAARGLWVMRHDPGIAFLCGPLALRSLLLAAGRSLEHTKFLSDYRSRPGGVSLAELAGLAERAGLDPLLVHREAGSEFPVPSLIHWKLDHYAALVAERAGHFQVKDPTFGTDLWVTREALAAESSGYFLILKGGDPPVGYRLVGEAEAAHVRGMGTTTDGKPQSTTPLDAKTKPAACGCGLPVYNFHETLVSVNVTDTPVGYAPPRGPPVFFTLTYNQREATQPANFKFGNVGPKWSLNWLSYIEDDPTLPGTAVTRKVGGGGAVDYVGYNSADGTFAREARDASLLVRVGPAVYERRLGDGSVEEYSTTDGSTVKPRNVFLTRVTDPTGDAVTLHYDNKLRLTHITDAVGRDTTLAYEAKGDDLLITSITDPFGRSAVMSYESIDVSHRRDGPPLLGAASGQPGPSGPSSSDVSEGGAPPTPSAMQTA